MGLIQSNGSGGIIIINHNIISNSKKNNTANPRITDVRYSVSNTARCFFCFSGITFGGKPQVNRCGLESPKSGYGQIQRASIILGLSVTTTAKMLLQLAKLLARDRILSIAFSNLILRQNIIGAKLLAQARIVSAAFSGFRTS
jgi:hypothetical protein